MLWSGIINNKCGVYMNQIVTVQYIKWFHKILETAIALYFNNDSEFSRLEDVEFPTDNQLEVELGLDHVTLEERVVILLALMPHISPQSLDIFFSVNKNTGRPYTEFGGWKGMSHGGFLPTGETAAFILAGDDIEKRTVVMSLFAKEHWFYKNNILRLDGASHGEPFLSGQLKVTDEFLSKVLFHRDFKPTYSSDFPAKLIETELNWEDLVVDYKVEASLEEMNTWIIGHRTIMEEWGLKKYLKKGYRALFYGPPGTGKTLTATLLGKRNNMDVYRVDLSMIVSKYIGETEKNLAKVFDLAESRNWILFFDEADALFGKRTSGNTSNDRHANQEVAFLLQRMEDYDGIIILATNLKANIDEAFARRFQSMVYFPIPDEQQRECLWENMLPQNWLGDDKKEILSEAIQNELSGGNIANLIRKCAIHLYSTNNKKLTKEIFHRIINERL